MPYLRHLEDTEHRKRRIQLVKEGYTHVQVDQIFEDELEFAKREEAIEDENPQEIIEHKHRVLERLEEEMDRWEQEEAEENEGINRLREEWKKRLDRFAWDIFLIEKKYGISEGDFVIKAEWLAEFEVWKKTALQSQTHSTK